MVKTPSHTARQWVSALFAAALILPACTDEPTELLTNDDAAAASESTTTSAAAAEQTAEPATGVGGPGSAWQQDAGSLSPAERNGLYRDVGAPPMMIDAGSPYEAVVSTARGNMRFRLFSNEAPVTVNNFVALADDGFFDGVTFHRVIPGFMAQGGDPAGDGRGGPGYTFDNEYTPGVEFGARGLIAMANAGPNTNGSQFFITFEEAGFLEASDYTVFGELVGGDDVLGSIAVRDPSRGGPPGDAITSVTIERG